MPGEHADYTVLQVESGLRDTLDAVDLLAPGWELEKAASDDRGWTLVPLSRRDAQWLAPALAQVIAKPVLSTTITRDTCSLSLATPDRQVLRADAGAYDAGRLLDALGRSAGDGLVEQAGQRLTWLLADRDMPAVERHRRADDLLGVPCPSRPDQPGVIAVWATVGAVRNRLPYAGHGAWVVPVTSRICVVVSDGTGWLPGPSTFEDRFTDSSGRWLPTLRVTWGELAEVEAQSERNRAFVLFQLLRGRSSVRSEAHDLADALELGPRGEEIADLLAGEGRVADRCGALLALAGVDGVPAGASVPELAEWAANRPRAVHVGPGHGDPDQGVPGRASPGQVGPGHSGPGHSGPGHSGPGHADPGLTGPGHADPGHGDPGRASPGHADPGHADPGHADPGHADAGHADAGHGERPDTSSSAAPSPGTAAASSRAPAAGTPAGTPAAEPAALRRVYRRRRVLRRLRRTAGWLELAGWTAGAGLLLWGRWTWMLGALGGVAGLIALRVALKRALRLPRTG